jgi:glutathione S-transferase
VRDDPAGCAQGGSGLHWLLPDLREINADHVKRLKEEPMLKLYHFEGSPFGWMARMALAEKGLKYEAVEPRDRDKNPELRGYNPINRTPTLVDEGRAAFESFAILEYLDEKYPNPPLMPKDPIERAHARAMALLGYLYIYQDARAAALQLFDWTNWDSKTQVYPARKPAETIDHAILDPAEERLMNHFGILDKELSQHPWATGSMFGIADIVLAPTTMGFKLRGRPLQEFKHVSKWLDACMARPAVKDTATPVVKRGTPV